MHGVPEVMHWWSRFLLIISNSNLHGVHEDMHWWSHFLLIVNNSNLHGVPEDMHWWSHFLFRQHKGYNGVVAVPSESLVCFKETCMSVAMLYEAGRS